MPVPRGKSRTVSSATDVAPRAPRTATARLLGRLALAALSAAGCSRTAYAERVARHPQTADGGISPVGAFVLRDAGEPDANLPAAEFRGIVCVRPDGTGAPQVDIEYATCTDGLRCVARANGRTVDVHAYWFGQAFMLCTAANLGETHCRADGPLPRDARFIRIDGNSQTIPLARSAADAGTSRCWTWPGGTATTSALHPR